jgi:ABC-type proline/glycine betaine transport system ATPase subunit
MHKYPNQLSGGQQQRVAIARTLALNPDVILLDEPISALDVTNREIMKAELKSLQKKFNATMLFITHDQEEAFFLSDRIMVMNEGVIEQIDTPLEIYKNPANDYVKEFVVDQLDKKYSDLLRYTGRTENA